MDMYEEVDVEKVFSGEDNIDDFNKFLKAYGIEDGLQDVTLKHTKDRLEALIAIAEEGTDPKLTAKKALLKKMLDNLKNEKDKIAAMKALKRIYSEEFSMEDMDIKELDKKLKHCLREYKKYEHFKKHEERIADKWIRNLTKKGNKIEN
ncbi:hypothetical protein ACFO6R_10975 [Eubacterium multiforme]|uniref:3-methyladenine DNA glycosylase AlkC n=1 Tax=Eubacterium multiforme TaxID=83339 RepID=A0ABT9UVG5_9FIRM|nr:hypothetical protein [Eubacterium multiforme]MDQ0150318.1 3-methyladenine DNA glycosylase AlkC [Eubacterium multiforme]